MEIEQRNKTTTHGKTFIFNKSYSGYIYTGQTYSKGFQRFFIFEKNNQYYHLTRASMRDLVNDNESFSQFCRRTECPVRR